LLLYTSSVLYTSSNLHTSFIMVAFRTIFSSFLAPIAILSQSVLAAGLFDFESNVSNHSLVARQAVVDAGVCATVDITLPGVTVTPLLTLQPIVVAEG
jgi:hypothetical protein